MANISNIVMTIILTAFSFTGCSTDDSKDEVEEVVENNPKENENANEKIEEEVTVYKCIKYSYPEVIASTGLMIVVPEPLTWFFGVSYLVANTYRCMTLDDPRLIAKEKELKRLSDDIKSASLRYFEAAKDSMKELVVSASMEERKKLRDDYDQIQDRIKLLTESEYSRLQRLSGKTLLEFYEQISVIKEGKFESVGEYSGSEQIPVKPVPVTEE